MQIRKKQLLAMIDSLKWTNANIERTASKHPDRIIQILTDCQEKAISVGTELEMRGAEEAVHLLEEYCECVYQMSQLLVDEKPVLDLKSVLDEKPVLDPKSVLDEKPVLDRLIKRCARLTAQIEERITNDLPEDKKEVVFLPYKASMWDSLESVWMAADEDENCETYVIPIPYFDKNPDGTVKTMHYEGGEYPDYVPVTPWTEYDIEARKPDVIYIHNPYDQYNYVTSVHPKFYASELKKHTDMLVYIPYFVCMDDVPEELCMTAAVLHADKVIVQSEKVMNTYKKVFIEQMGSRQRKKEQKTGIRDEKYWKKLRQTADEKFLALGSPKIDKVFNTTRDKVTVPEEWQKKIEAPEGRRKVVFYNTTVDAFLKYKGDYLDKLERVLKEFENNTETVLLWRPHPLLDSTAEALAPQLCDRYREIVGTYKKKDWGIYDDTADVNRAIALSDAYYGDWSSVVALYRETGKPMMIQNIEI